MSALPVLQPIDPGELQLDDEEARMDRGEYGKVLQWAIRMQIETGVFFGAKRLVPVTNSHMMGDYEVMGKAGCELAQLLCETGAKFRIPTTTDPRCVDFAAAECLRQDKTMVSEERELVRNITRMGGLLTNTCINYQSVYQPRFREHVAWGDTGAVIYCNAVLGARSNFESGPAAMAAGLTGRTPEYGFHLDRHRRGTMRFNVSAALEDLSDWGALGAAIARHCDDYWQVPVLEGVSLEPSSDELKHLGASLASYGSLAMFHILGTTPEAPSVEDLAADAELADPITISDQEIRAIYDSFAPNKREVDLVVLTGPQLSILELQRVSELIKGHSVCADTKLIITTNLQNYTIAQEMGIMEPIERAGALVLKGTCFYLMGAGDMREKFGWTNVLTNSAKFANIMGGYRYRPVLRRTTDCIRAAVDGRLH